MVLKIFMAKPFAISFAYGEGGYKEKKGGKSGEKLRKWTLLKGCQTSLLIYQNAYGHKFGK